VNQAPLNTQYDSVQAKSSLKTLLRVVRLFVNRVLQNHSKKLCCVFVWTH